MGAHNWYMDFDQRPLFRGKDYYTHGLVHDLRWEKDCWHASVEGTWDYDVIVAATRDGSPDPYGSATHCTCPYYASNDLCKHIAATCFAIEGEDVPHEGDAERSEWEALLDSTTPKERLEFLRSVLSRDASLRREFVARFGEPDVEAARHNIEVALDDALYKYGDGYGRIRWDHSLAFESEVCNAVRDTLRPYMERKSWQDAFDVSLAALAVIRTADVDDSDGFYSTAQEACFDAWRSILEKGGSVGAEVVAKGIPKLLEADPDEDESIDVFEMQQGDAFDFFVNAFKSDPDHALAVYRICDSVLAGRMWVSCWNPKQRCAIAGVHALRTMGKAMEERLAFTRPYLSYLEVRKEMANELVEEDRTEEAVRLLKGGFAACERPDQIVSLHKALLDCYVLLDNRDMTQATLEELIRRTGSADDALGWWCSLRDLVDDSEWDDMANGLIAQIQVRQVLHALLAEEGQLARLMDEFESSADVEDLKNYDQVLTKDYLDRVLKLYRAQLTADLARASSRNGYRAALAYLSHMNSLPGAQGVCVDAAQEIRATYPRRPALHDELSKIGL